MEGFCILTSGSKGNCTFFGSQSTKILIDAGVSVKVIEQKLALLDLSLSMIDAVFITHEHSDHIKGLFSLCRQYDIPVVCNSDTAKVLYDLEGKHLQFRVFFTGESFAFGDIEVSAFSVQHDAVDPVAYTFCVGGIKTGICTDLGFATTLVKKELQGCDYLVLEANHHVPMVHSSSRPKIYKDRVLSKMGHLSNEQCRDLLLSIGHEGLKHVHLAHLSSECNSSEVALDTVKSGVTHLFPYLEISIAYQEKISNKILFSPLKGVV